MKRWIIVGAIVVGILVLAWFSNREEDSGTRAAILSRAPLAILEQVNAGQANLVDVRTKVEYDLQHAEGAQLFNIEWLQAGQLPNLPKDAPLYVYCRTGNRSAVAAQILEANGFSAVIDLGGIQNWVNGNGALQTTELKPHDELLTALGQDKLEALGDQNAPITMIKYADFQCSYCQKFALQTEPEIRRTYVDTGKVKYEYRNAAFLGDKSAYGAIGGYCANEQSSFWPYHDRLNAQASQLGQAAFSYDALTSMVQGLGLDSEAFYACLTSGKYDDVVSSETIAAKRAGYNSTPTFVVGTQKLDGALPFATFAALIDSQL